MATNWKSLDFKTKLEIICVKSVAHLKVNTKVVQVIVVAKVFHFFFSDACFKVLQIFKG
jgi:hypothetical protein